MSQANIQLVQSVYAAFGRGDIAAVLDALTTDVSWGMVGREQDVPMAGIRSGKAGAGQFFQLLRETQEITRFEPLKFAATEDMVFCWGRAEWTMCASGVAGANDWLHVMTVRDGKVCEWRGHQDTALLAQAFHATPARQRVTA